MELQKKIVAWKFRQLDYLLWSLRISSSAATVSIFGFAVGF